MPRIDSLPGIKIIRGFHGVLDFYMRRGRAYVRSWPVTPRRNLTPATLAAAATFGQVLKSYRLLADTVLAAFKEDAADHERTARDIFVSAVHGHLHEAAMSDFLTALQACRDSLAALEALLGALGSVDTDDLQVDVKTSALPALAATATHQITQNTALATIATLEEALATVATDRLITKGEDQLFSIDFKKNTQWSGNIVGADGYFDSGSVPANKYWIITTVTAWDQTSPTTRIRLSVFDGANTVYFREMLQAIAADEICEWSGHIFLDTDDIIRAYFLGGQIGDTCHIRINGYQMTLET